MTAFAAPRRLFSTLSQRLAAATLAGATTVALLSAVVGVADGYQADAQLAQQAARPVAASAPQQVVITGRRSLRG